MTLGKLQKICEIDDDNEGDKIFVPCVVLAGLCSCIKSKNEAIFFRSGFEKIE